MRREGYEFQVSRPEVITREIDGEHARAGRAAGDRHAEEYIGAVTELLGPRRAQPARPASDDGRAACGWSTHPDARPDRLPQRLPDRDARQRRRWASVLLGYEPWAGAIGTTRNGALVASETGVATDLSACSNAQERGMTFIEPGTPVYEGMIVGQQPRRDDLVVNVCKEKKLTNMRSSTADIAVRLTPPVEA